MRRRRIVAHLVLMTLLLFFAPRLTAEHRPGLDWMRGYKGADGTSCCGQTDCIKAETRLVTEPNGATVNVEIAGIYRHHDQVRWVMTTVTLPVLSVHRSEEPVGYWCYWNGSRRMEPPADITPETTRCVFVTVGN